MRLARKRTYGATLSEPCTAKRLRLQDDQDGPQEFREDLLDRLSLGLIGWLDLATIAWKSTRAGAAGVEDLAVDPRQKGANQAARVRHALGLEALDARLYRTWIPMWDTHTSKRTMGLFVMKLPHECITEDFMKNKVAYEKARSDPDWIDVPSFTEHVVTKLHGKDECWPIGLYTDKVKLGPYNSFYRGSVKCTCMRAAITTWVLKSEVICKCGCNGNCTLNAIQFEINNSIKCLQDKVYLPARLDGKPFGGDEPLRKQRANSALPIRGVCCEYRADLPERCMRSGIKTQAANHGCIS